MRISLTEELFDTLRPDGKDTAWMFSNDEYISMEIIDGRKSFCYTNTELEVFGIFKIDPMFHTAGFFIRETNYIAIELEKETTVLYEKDNIVPFKKG